MKKPAQCLLIEDDLDDQEIFLLCLKRIKQDVTCVIANNGVEALQKLKENDQYIPDVIFLDVNMPKMNGFDCLRELRSMSRLTNTRVYIYSTTSEGTVIDQAKFLGANEYIMKPTKAAELKDKLAYIFTLWEQAGFNSTF